ncbi:MAG TPA: phosphate ABC transporter permease PstA [Candidatus Polarisedimenticolaceae bacterium]|nr:phosphate ABC transporter permease PstA [Candidatus Polarisedimenticolaceae bacterium]
MKKRRSGGRVDWLGDGLTSLCAGALALNVLLVIALLCILVVNGMGYFWQRPLVEMTVEDGMVYLGEIQERESIPATDDDGTAAGSRVRIKVGNRDLTGVDFVWIDEPRVESRRTPDDAVLLERLEYGNFYGFLERLQRGDEVLAEGSAEVWEAFQSLHADKLREATLIRRLEKREIGDVNHAMERLRLAERRIDRSELDPSEREQRLARLRQEQALAESEYEALSRRLFDMRERWAAETLMVRAVNGALQQIPVANVVRAVRPNQLGTTGRLALYLERIWEFLSSDPRESNTEGGIFPAIFGTVMMVFLMSFAVAPLGVLAALYLREYAKQGPLVRTVRIAVNNLAGVPSIVFGVFGLGFFVYLVGGSIDRLFYPESLPTPTFGTGGILWASLTLALLTVPVVIVATEEGLAAVPRIVREGSLALGATKFETTWRVVVPAAAPGILTGLILAMARAAGEVAPLMIVGMVKLAPALPVDHHFPFVHFERKFMHLGFHIYDVGFQSPNVEATKPLVFATALLLILVVTAMNLLAIGARNHLRRKYMGSAV